MRSRVTPDLDCKVKHSLQRQVTLKKMLQYRAITVTLKHFMCNNLFGINSILGPCLNQCLMDYTDYLFYQKETLCLGSIIAELFIAISSAKTCSNSHIIIISSERTKKHNWPPKCLGNSHN